MEFYIYWNGEQTGPFSEESVKANLLSGVFSGSDLAFREGLTEWMPLSQLFPEHCAKPSAPAPTLSPSTGERELRTNVKQGAVIGGAVCFTLAIICMAWSLWSFIIYGPLLLAAFVLSIVAMSQRRIIGGVALLLATLVVPTVLWVVLAAQRTHQFAETFSKELHSDSISASSVESLPESSASGTPTSLDTNEAPATVDDSAVEPTASTTEDDRETVPLTNKTAQASSVPEVIDGAFGKKLGDVFDPESAIGKEALTDGTPMYKFTTEKPFRSFTEYYILITPVSHKIYSIWGRGPVANTESGKKEQALIMQLLGQKYGPSEKQGLMESLSDMHIISHGKRHVLTKVTGFADVTIEIRYNAHDLSALAEKERLQVEAKKVDSGGL